MSGNLINTDRQSERPGKKAPVAQLIDKIIEKNPGMEFEDARQEANRLLCIAAGKRNYKMPTVYSPEEIAAFKARMLGTSTKSKAAA